MESKARPIGSAIPHVREVWWCLVSSSLRTPWKQVRDRNCRPPTTVTVQERRPIGCKPRASLRARFAGSARHGLLVGYVFLDSGVGYDGGMWREILFILGISSVFAACGASTLPLDVEVKDGAATAGA